MSGCRAVSHVPKTQCVSLTAMYSGDTVPAADGGDEESVASETHKPPAVLEEVTHSSGHQHLTVPTHYLRFLVILMLNYLTKCMCA